MVLHIKGELEGKGGSTGVEDKAARQGKSAFISISSLATTEKGIRATENWLNYIGVVFTILLMLMVVLQVILRYFFRSPISGYIDIMEILMVPLVFLCLAYCQREGGHIRFEVLMTGTLRKGRSYYAMECLHLFLTLVAFSVITYYSLTLALQARAIGDITLNLYLPTWPARMSAAIGSFFISLRFFVQLLDNLNMAVTSR